MFVVCLCNDKIQQKSIQTFFLKPIHPSLSGEKIFKLRVYNIKNTLIFQRFKIINKESQLFSDVIYCKHEKYNINVTLKTQNYSLPPEKQHSGKGRVKKKYEFFVKKYENNREIFNYFFR